MTVEALRRRRPQTLAELLDAHGREIQAVAYLILRDRADAEDVTIETLLTAFEKGGSIRDDARRPGVAPQGRDEQGARRSAGAARGSSASTSCRTGPRRATSPARRRATSRCWPASPTCRRRCGPPSSSATTPTCPVEDVAAALGKSPNTIKAQLQTALDRLRRSLADPAATRPRPGRPAMHDQPLEQKLRAALRAEGDGLPSRSPRPSSSGGLSLRRRGGLGPMASLGLAAAVGIGLLGLVGVAGGWFDQRTAPAAPPPSPVAGRERQSPSGGAVGDRAAGDVAIARPAIVARHDPHGSSAPGAVGPGRRARGRRAGQRSLEFESRAVAFARYHLRGISSGSLPRLGDLRLGLSRPTRSWPEPRR